MNNDAIELPKFSEVGDTWTRTNPIIIAVLVMAVVADVGVIAGASVRFGSGREDFGIGTEGRERHKRDGSKKSDVFI